MTPQEFSRLSLSEQTEIWSSLEKEEQLAIREAQRANKAKESTQPLQTSIIPPEKPEKRVVSQDSVEYRIISQRDKLFSGRFEADSITQVLNQLASEGWRFVGVTSAGVNTLLGGNRDEILIFLERRNS